MTEKLYIEIVRLYEVFYMKISGNRDFLFKPSKTQKKQIENFIHLLLKQYNGSVGNNFLFNYFALQFFHWSNKETRFGKNKIQLNWVIGEKALEFYNDNNIHEIQIREFLTKYNIVNNSFEKLELNNELEEAIKAKYPNNLMNCLIFTTLYDKTSPQCLKCTEKADCIIMLKSTYPKLYEKRI